MPPPLPVRHRRLGDLLVETGLIDDLKLKAALAEQRRWGGKLGRTLVDMAFVTEAEMARVLAQQLHLKGIDLDTAQLPEQITQHLRLDLAERYGVFAVGFDAQEKWLELATSDPTNVEALQELEFATDLKVVPVVATASAIDRAIRRFYFGESTTATVAATPQSLGVAETTYELDLLLGAPPQPRPTAPAPASSEPNVSPEVALLKGQVDTLEKIVASQVRALRSLLELLIESGLVSREEYLQKLHRGE